MQVTTDVKNPIIRYYGGKWTLAPWIVSHFPSHQGYLEVCGGSASVLLQKPISNLETYNDIDKHVVNFFKVIRDNPNELIRRLELTPYAREEWLQAKESCLDEDPIESARRFLFSSISSINNLTHEKSSGFRTESFAGQNFKNVVKVFRSSVMDSIKTVANRFKYVQIENKEASYVIERYGHKNTLIYFDPPYVKETRSSGTVYRYEVDNKFHIEIAELLHKTKAFVVVSGYNCQLYETLYGDWYRIDKESQVNGGGSKTESLWLSPNIELNKSVQKSLF